MQIEKNQLQQAVNKGLLSQKQVQPLWEFLSARTSVSAPGLSAVSFYVGALIVIAAMGVFMTLGWEQFGGGGIMALALLYGGAFAAAGAWLWKKEGLSTLGGLCVTIAVFMMPLAIYGFEAIMHVWPAEPTSPFRDFWTWIRASWVFMEVGTAIAALVALWFVPFPFLTFPLALAAWFLSMDIVPLLSGHWPEWHETLWVALYFGMAMLIVAYIVDWKYEQDYAFWLYFFGLISFTCGLSLLWIETGEGAKLLSALISVLLVILSVLLNRTIFMVFGAIGLFSYLGYLSYSVFQDSVLFPFVLSGLGILIMGAGVGYQKYREKIERAVLDNVPESLRKLSPRR